MMICGPEYRRMKSCLAILESVYGRMASPPRHSVSDPKLGAADDER